MAGLVVMELGVGAVYAGECLLSMTENKAGEGKGESTLLMCLTSVLTLLFWVSGEHFLLWDAGTLQNTICVL